MIFSGLISEKKARGRVAGLGVGKDRKSYYTPHLLIFSDTVKSQIKQEDQYC